MSLVGPAPAAARRDCARIEIRAQRRRLSVPPGLTCLWQISGRNEITSFDEWVRLDLAYIDSWSLWLDIKILFRTVPVVLTGLGCPLEVAATAGNSPGFDWHPTASGAPRCSAAHVSKSRSFIAGGLPKTAPSPSSPEAADSSARTCRDRLLAEGHCVVAIDNLITGNTRNIEHLAGNERFHFIKHDVTQYIFVPGPGGFRISFRLSRPARSITSNCPFPRSRSARIGTHNTLGLAKAKGAKYPARLHLRMLRRSARAPAEGGLLGQREPDRAARRLRRGQALRRGHDHGLSPLSQDRHQDCPHLQHLRSAHAPARRPRGAGVHRPGAHRPAADRLRRRQADAELLLRLRPRSTAFSASRNRTSTSR